MAEFVENTRLFPSYLGKGVQEMQEIRQKLDKKEQKEWKIEQITGRNTKKK